MNDRDEELIALRDENVEMAWRLKHVSADRTELYHRCIALRERVTQLEGQLLAAESALLANGVIE